MVVRHGPHSACVSAARTTSLLLEKGGAAIKPFVPQLQSIFIKSFNDVNTVRTARGEKRSQRNG